LIGFDPVSLSSIVVIASSDLIKDANPREVKDVEPGLVPEPARTDDYSMQLSSLFLSAKIQIKLFCLKTVGFYRADRKAF